MIGNAYIAAYTLANGDIVELRSATLPSGPVDTASPGIARKAYVVDPSGNVGTLKSDVGPREVTFIVEKDGVVALVQASETSTLVECFNAACTLKLPAASAALLNGMANVEASLDDAFAGFTSASPQKGWAATIKLADDTGAAVLDLQPNGAARIIGFDGDGESKSIEVTARLTAGADGKLHGQVTGILAVEGEALPSSVAGGVDPDDWDTFGFTVDNVASGEFGSVGNRVLASLTTNNNTPNFGISSNHGVDANGNNITTLKIGNDSFTATIDDDGDVLGYTTIAYSVATFGGAFTNQVTDFDADGDKTSTITDTTFFFGDTRTIRRTYEATISGEVVVVNLFGSDAEVRANLKDPKNRIEYEVTGVKVGSETYEQGSVIADYWDKILSESARPYTNGQAGELGAAGIEVYPGFESSSDAKHAVSLADPNTPTGAIPSFLDLVLDPNSQAAQSATYGINAGLGFMRALREESPTAFGKQLFKFVSAEHKVGGVAVLAPEFELFDTADNLVSGLRNLRSAFERGDIGAIASSSGGLYQTLLQLELRGIQAAGAAAGVTFTTTTVQLPDGSFVTTYATTPITGAKVDTDAAAKLGGDFQATSEAIKSAGEFLSYLNLVNSLANGDVAGAVIAAISIFNPVLGGILSFVQMALGDTVGGSADFSARGFFREKSDGTIEVVYADEDGEGQTPLAAMMKSIAEKTHKTIATKPMTTVTRGMKDTKSVCLKTLRRQKLRLRLGQGVASCQVQVGTLRQAMIYKYRQLETLSFMSFPFKR